MTKPLPNQYTAVSKYDTAKLEQIRADEFASGVRAAAAVCWARAESYYGEGTATKFVRSEAKACAAAILALVPVSHRTFYMGAGGNDANDGTTWAKRKLTSSGFVAGDMVYTGTVTP